MYRLLLLGLIAASVLVTSAGAEAQAAFLLYPNYRGLIFDDRPEIVVEAPAGAAVTVTDGVTGATALSATSQTGRVVLSAATLTTDHAYMVSVRQGGTLLAQWPVAPVPASRRASMRISFDPRGRLLMHGRPRFVLGVYDSGGGYSPDPAHYERILFAPGGARELGTLPINLYLNYHWGNAPVPAMHALMDVLHKRGIMYLQTGNCFAEGSHTRMTFGIHADAYVTQFAQHPGAAGYYTADECVDGLIPETAANHRRLARLDPESMTMAITLAKGYIDPRKWVDAADVIGTDPYPLYGKEPAAGYTHFQVGDYVAYARAAVRDTRPTIAVLQFFKFTSDSRYPTAAELRAHAVMSIVEGARGLFWWDIGTNGVRKNADPATVAAQMANLRSLVTELAALEPALVADDVPGALTGNSTRHPDPLAGRKAQLQRNIAVEWLFSNKRWYQEELDRLNAGNTSWSPMLADAATIRTKVKVVGGTGYVFAYNYTNETVPATFTWRQAPGSVTEHRTGRSYPISGASWSDSFGPYEARIYVVANGGGGAAAPAAPAATAPAPAGPSLMAAVLPGSRSVQVGSPATAFVTVLNTGGATAQGVTIRPATTIPATVTFQTTDPATNAPTGSVNAPVDIPAGGSRSFVITLTPTAPFNPTTVPFTIAGTNAAAVRTVSGVNTLLLSASPTPVADIVALAAVAGNTGILALPSAGATGAFAVATANLGAGGELSVVPDGVAGLPVQVSVCQTSAATGACLASPTRTVTATIATGAAPTFAVFVRATGPIAFDPAAHRVFVRFRDAAGVVRGMTSVAARTP